MVPVPLQFGGFLPFRPFGLPFAAVAVAIALGPRELSRRRLRTAEGDAATLEPTDAQALVMRVSDDRSRTPRSVGSRLTDPRR